MDGSENVVLWMVFVWIVASSFLFSALENRIIKRLKLVLSGSAKDINKNTFSNPLQNYKSIFFFFKHKVGPHDTEEIKVLIRKGRTLNVVYFAQLAVIGVVMINLFESLSV